MANIEKIVLPDNTEYDINIPAGENNPIKNSIYIDSLNNEWQGVQLEKNGEKKATLAIGTTSTAETLVIARQNDSDALLGGMQVKNNDNVIFANAGTIAFRPNGVNATTGQVYIGTDGQIVGALKYYNASNWNDTTMTAYTWYNKAGISLPVGRYIVTGIVQVKGENATSGAKVICTVGANYDGTNKTDGFAVGLNHPSGNNASTSFSLPLNLSSATTVYLWGDSQVTGIHWTGAVLYAIRIN